MNILKYPKALHKRLKEKGVYSLAMHLVLAGIWFAIASEMAEGWSTAQITEYSNSFAWFLHWAFWGTLTVFFGWCVIEQIKKADLH